MIIGYARVSTDDQNLHLQNDELKKAGCEKYFEDKVTGSKIDRPGLDAAIDYAREGDVIVVWRLDRLSRSLKDLIQVVSDLESNGIGLKSINESIDTTSSSGKLIFHIFGALAEFERNLIRERTHAGLKAARARGKMGGRPKKLNAEKAKLAQDLYNEKTRTIKQICELVGISKPTLYKYLR
ncbi:recombinase family protein [Legionella israelensis]|uniref:recombinase family protein n=1 Tax=Legionella israelensis TaxID=454 RepID=UPI00118099AA|nr:recombinase family protein [Legionella israelensis]QDP72187.1 recombinase family protein [Legionella israelensis]